MFLCRKCHRATATYTHPIINVLINSGCIFSHLASADNADFMDGEKVCFVYTCILFSVCKYCLLCASDCSIRRRVVFVLNVCMKYVCGRASA